MQIWLYVEFNGGQTIFPVFFYYNMKSLSVLLSTYGCVIFDWLKVEFYIKYPHDKKLSFMVYQFVLRTESI